MPTGMSAGALMALGAAGSTVLSMVMAPDKESAPAAAAPEVKPPTPMPDEKATRSAAQRTSLLDQQRRRGRASTILTDSASLAADPLGG
jgi:hypothetical protein